jgi:hypothetical protein
MLKTSYLTLAEEMQRLGYAGAIQDYKGCHSSGALSEGKWG